MLTRVIYHDRCFDGAASAALLSRFLQDYYYPDGKFEFQGVLHTPHFQWNPEMFDGEENAIVDFRYSPDPRVTWWFDHHQSAFLSREDEQHFDRTRTSRKLLDCRATSCTSLIASYLKDLFQYEAPELQELIQWADVIDGAKYPNPEAAVELQHPAVRLKLVIEYAKSADIREYVIRKLRYASIEEVASIPLVVTIQRSLVQDQLDFIEILLKRFRRHGKIGIFDLLDTRVERHNKLLPYALFSGLDYSVALLRVGNVVKVSLGTNPWSTSTQLVNLASLAEQYGGGGHSAVAGIALDPRDASRAHEIVEEIVERLNQAERPAFQSVNSVPD